MRHRHPAVAVAVVSLVLLTACASTQVINTSSARQVYGPRWIPLPIPDSRIMPGAIVSIRRNQVAWESNLATCGAPERVLTSQSSAGVSISTTSDAEYGASAALSVKGVEAGPEFDRVKKTTLKLDDHSAHGLDAIELGTWINAPGTVLSETCRQFLTRDNIFIVQEAYRVGKGRFTLYDSRNRKIGLTGLSIGPLKIEANASAKITEEGDLEFDAPMFTAIRNVKLLKNGTLKTLGMPGGANDDAVAVALLSGQKTSSPQPE